MNDEDKVLPYWLPIGNNGPTSKDHIRTRLEGARKELKHLLSIPRSVRSLACSVRIAAIQTAIEELEVVFYGSSTAWSEFRKITHELPRSRRHELSKYDSIQTQGIQRPGMGEDNGADLED